MNRIQQTLPIFALDEDDEWSSDAHDFFGYSCNMIRSCLAFDISDEAGCEFVPADLPVYDLRSCMTEDFTVSTGICMCEDSW